MTVTIILIIKVIINMFFQLPEFEKMQRSIQSLQSNKQALQSLIAQAYTPQQKVNSSLCKTLQQIMSKTIQDIKQLTKIQNDVESGFMIPQQIYVKDLLYEREGLPDWFQFVFQKQFLKQKKNFDVVAKKTYKIHALREKKQELEIQAQSFKILYERFTALNGKQKEALNIMSEAQSLKNKTNLLKEKYSCFCQLIASKILNFLQQNCNKALSYHGQVSDFAQRSSYGDFPGASTSFLNANERSRINTNMNQTKVSFMPQRSHLQDRPYTIKNSMPLTSTGFSVGQMERQRSREHIGYGMQYGRDSPSKASFISQNHGHSVNFNQKTLYNQPSLRSIHEHQRSVAQSRLNQMGYGVYSHSNFPIMTQNGLNYRNYVPRVFNTATNYY